MMSRASGKRCRACASLAGLSIRLVASQPRLTYDCRLILDQRGSYGLHLFEWRSAWWSSRTTSSAWLQPSRPWHKGDGNEQL